MDRPLYRLQRGPSLCGPVPGVPRCLKGRLLSLQAALVVVGYLCLFDSPPLAAEQGILRLFIVDTGEQPIPGVVLTCQGPGGTTPVTTTVGKTRLRLASSTAPGDWLALQILDAASGGSWVFISPWNGRVLVPPFEEAAENYLPLVLAKRSDRAMLEDSGALAAITASIIEEVQRKSRAYDKITAEQRQRILDDQAAQFGLPPEEVDEAIRSWQKRTQNPYEKGLAALYEENYPEATLHLRASLEMREKELATALAGVVDAAFFLGQSLHHQGKFREAVEALSRADALGPGDGRILTALGDAQHQAGDLEPAEDTLRRALEAHRGKLGDSYPEVIDSWRSLAYLLTTLGRFDEAERLHRKVLDLRQGSLGPRQPELARDLHKWAGFLITQARYKEAEKAIRRSIDLSEETQGSSHPEVGDGLELLGVTLMRTGERWEEAEAALLRSLSIRERALGPQHPEVGGSLANLAIIYRFRGPLEEAESHLSRAIPILEQGFGADHHHVAMAKGNLGVVLGNLGRLEEAQERLQESNRILEKSLGPRHMAVGTGKHHLGNVYLKQGLLEPAERNFVDALAITAESLGADHPDATFTQRDLAAVYRKLGRREESIALLEQAIAINDTAIGAHHPRVLSDLGIVGETYAEGPNSAAALPAFERLVGRLEGQDQPPDPDVLASLKVYASLLRSLQRPAEAQAVEIRYLVEGDPAPR